MYAKNVNQNNHSIYPDDILHNDYVTHLIWYADVRVAKSVSHINITI